MLILLVKAGEYTYAIPAHFVSRVVPQVKVTKIPQVCHFLIGHINFSGKPIPVVDLCLLVNKLPAARSMHTRIVLLQPSGADSATLGLLAEKVTETAAMDNDAFVDPGVHPSTLPFLDGVFEEGETAIQLIDIDKLYAYVQSEAMR
jgi:chemotaxis-related protein WspB